MTVGIVVGAVIPGLLGALMMAGLIAVAVMVIEARWHRRETSSERAPAAVLEPAGIEVRRHGHPLPAL
jgi:hypothetical protein